MATLTKMDLVQRLSEKYEMEVASTRRIIQGVLDIVTESLVKGDKVELRNFGVFEVVERAGRIARNPKSKQEVFIPQRRIVKFKPGKIMEEEITLPSMKGGIQPAPSRIAGSAHREERRDEPPRVPDQATPQ